MHQKFPAISRSVLTPTALWLLTTAYILLFPTHHYTSDAINNLYFLESGNLIELWHTQHLLAQWPGFWLYQVLHALVGDSIRAWQAMRLAHALLAGLTVALVYNAARKLTPTFWQAILSATVLWFSYGFWHFQSDPDIYSLGYFTAALLMVVYITFVQSPTIRHVTTLGLTAALAILAHQINVLAVGMVGLSLVYWMFRTDALARRRLVWYGTVYSGLVVLIVLAAYLAGWFSVNAYHQHLGQPEVAFQNWAMRYFAMARAGQATWGVSSNLASLPTAVYTFLSTWVLPMPVQQTTPWSLGVLALIVIALLGVTLHMAVVFRDLPPNGSLLALVCAGTLLVNAVAGWWWQAGNIKFYLFMQIPMILLAAFYLRQLSFHAGRHRRLGLALLGVIWVGLAMFHVTSTLPYETSGGVFKVADLAGDRPVAIWFESQDHRRWFTYITPHDADLLPHNFCHETPPAPGPLWWVVSEQTAANCPALAGMTRIGSYQADRSRRIWGIFQKND